MHVLLCNFHKISVFFLQLTEILNALIFSYYLPDSTAFETL